MADVFAHQAQAVEDGGGSNDGRAVLVVVEYRDFAAFAQFFLNVEAFGRFDVFQVDAAESGLERGDDVHQFFGVGFIDFDIEHVDAGEFFKQYAFAFHHRFAGLGADIAQTEHGGAVGNHGHQVAARGVFVGVLRVGLDFQTGGGHAGRVGQRQVVLGGQCFGGGYLNFAGLRILVKIEGGLFQHIVHGIGPFVGWKGKRA